MGQIYDATLLSEVVILREELAKQTSKLYKFKDELDPELAILYISKLYDYIKSVFALENVFKMNKNNDIYVDYHTLVYAIDYMRNCEKELYLFDAINSYIFGRDIANMMNNLPVFQSKPIYDLFKDNAIHCIKNINEEENYAYLDGLYLEVCNQNDIKPGYKLVYGYEEYCKDLKYMGEEKMLINIESRMKTILSAD